MKMSDKEMLNKIINNTSFSYTNETVQLGIDEYNFLIQQAGMKIDTYRANTEWQEQHRIQEERANRYEQALKEIVKHNELIGSKFVKATAQKALEVD
jgi:hypothetical protein